MTEKQYGGSTGRGSGEKTLKMPAKPAQIKSAKKSEKQDKDSKSDINAGYIKAGKIASEAVRFAKSIIEKGMPLLEIAEKIEAKIIELGGKPAFPVNLSIDEIAAHYTPAFNDAATAKGLLKVDIGAHVDGCIADTAFSIDLEDSQENKKLIEASELALKKACEIIKEGIFLKSIGKAIEEAIKSFGFTPINNLSGHQVGHYLVHAGITIPNFYNAQEKPVEEGVYAIEPFATTGLGSVRDGKLSEIYRIEKSGNVRDSFAREVLAFIEKEYRTLPFCSRWLVKKFGARAILALRRIEEAGLVHRYPELVETGGKKVSQAEHTIIIEKSRSMITTI